MSIDSEKPVTLNRLGRALVWTSIGVVVGLVELVLFSWIAHLFWVEVNVATMAMNWLVAFYALFIIPIVCFLLAFITVFG